MTYERYLAPTVEAFVHKLVTGYVVHGYHFYVKGKLLGGVPNGKISEELLIETDLRMLKKFRADASPRTRARRKQAGICNTRYLRLKGFSEFVVVSTYGTGSTQGDLHPFFESYRELVDPKTGEVVREKQFRDFRREPLFFHGYSISLKPEGVRPKRGYRKQPPVRGTKYRGCVAIHMEEYRALKAFMVEQAKHRSLEQMIDLFQSLPYKAYARVWVQLNAIRKACNEARKKRGFSPIPMSVLPRRRTPSPPCEFPGEEEIVRALEAKALEAA